MEIFVCFIGAETQKSGRSTPVALMQTLGYGAEIPGGPTVKSLDDTTDSSIRASDREEMASRIKEVCYIKILLNYIPSACVNIEKIIKAPFQ